MNSLNLIGNSRTVRLLVLMILSLLMIWSHGPIVFSIFLVVGLITFFFGRLISLAEEEKSQFSLAALGSFIIILIWAGFKAQFVRIDDRIIEFPDGLSFYSFLAIAYLIDLYWGVSKKPVGFLEFASWFSYYPKFVLGPLLRFPDFRNQTESVVILTRENSKRAILLILVGFVKVKLAESCLPFLTETFNHFETKSVFEHWAAIFGLMGQIFGNFSGFVDIVTGLSYFLGILLPKNFDKPYLAESPLEFWASRWHITLSHWIKDYIFLPTAMHFRNWGRWGLLIAFFVAMFVGAVWHEFTDKAIFFFAFHFSLCVVWYLLENQKSFQLKWIPAPWKRIFRIALTLYFFVICECVIKFPNVERYFDFIQLAHLKLAEIRFASFSGAPGIVLLATLLVFLIDWIWNTERLQSYFTRNFWSSLFAVLLLVWLVSPQFLGSRMPSFFYGDY